MSLKARILLGFLALFGAAFYLISDSIVKEMRPRYLEAVEESLNDTAHTLASLMETQVKNGRIDTTLLKTMFDTALDRRFSAKIFGFSKTRVGLHAYVTDGAGKVIYDSRGDETLGQDFSRWNDVHNTLRGSYGARSTRVDPKDPMSSRLFVAAPIRNAGRVIGVITVIKPQDSVTPFIELAKRKLLVTGLLTAVAFALLSIVLSFLISKPLTKLGEYVRRLRHDDSARLPKLGAREIRELGEEFASLWEELRGKKYIEEYVQALTHELKSPLTSIRGSSELLMEEMPDEQRRTFHRNIVRESRRMEEIIGRMLELATLENRRELRDTERISLPELAGEVLDGFAPRIAEKNLAVESRIEPGVSVRGERFLLHHALANLVDNALRFSPVGGSVVLSASKEGTMARVSVTDSGPGMPDYASGKIFERFYSLPDPASGKKGTGLGLPFVKEAAALHGGFVTVANRPEGGAVATLIIPL
ncbi:MAG: two-component system sensor histidine kinase CreC [Spirochaetes bacterium]|nr:two-component system sensor histidine kinase CreC [Spirochaetota bacterium]